MKHLLAGALAPLALAMTACGAAETKTVTVGDSGAAAASAAVATTTAEVETAAAPAPKPVVELDSSSPEATTHDEVVLKGTVTRGARVKVGGTPVAVTRGRWSTTVVTSKRGEHVFRVKATRRGYEANDLEVLVTRKLSAAEKAAIRAAQAERRAGARALESAKSYLAMSGFSKQGLYEQLSSSSGEGFTAAQAQYAIDHVHANWKKEAVESARSYLEMSSFSRSALIEQLSSSSGEGFTYEEALYAVNKVY